MVRSRQGKSWSLCVVAAVWEAGGFEFALEFGAWIWLDDFLSFGFFFSRKALGGADFDVSPNVIGAGKMFRDVRGELYRLGNIRAIE